MQMQKVRPATNREAIAVMRTITLGFSGDPVARWIWPEPDIYLHAMPEFAMAFGGSAFDHGSAYVTEDFGAASLWLPPEAGPDDRTIEKLLKRTVSAEISDEVDVLFDRMEAFHPRDRACWYLPMIAADPALFGRGLGASLLRRGLSRCDEDGIPVYLESSNPRNLSLYERHGFEVLGEIRAGSSPCMIPMLREARS